MPVPHLRHVWLSVTRLTPAGNASLPRFDNMESRGFQRGVGGTVVPFRTGGGIEQEVAIKTPQR